MNWKVIHVSNKAHFVSVDETPPKTKTNVRATHSNRYKNTLCFHVNVSNTSIETDSRKHVLSIFTSLNTFLRWSMRTWIYCTTFSVMTKQKKTIKKNEWMEFRKEKNIFVFVPILSFMPHDNEINEKTTKIFNILSRQISKFYSINANPNQIGRNMEKLIEMVGKNLLKWRKWAEKVCRNGSVPFG